VVNPGQPPVIGGDPEDVWADLRRAYEAVMAAPYRTDRGPTPLLTFKIDTSISHAEINDPDLPDLAARRAVIDDAVRDAIFQQVQQLAEAAETARRSGCVLCVHDGPAAEVVQDESFLADEPYTVQVRQRAHLLMPGQQCATNPRTQYVGTAVDEVAQEFGAAPLLWDDWRYGGPTP
jgi:hypothetical protein